jgi:hypothetical protein
MQNHYFNQKNSIKGADAALGQINAQKTPASPFNSDDYCSDSLNELNVAFIAEESKMLLSDSQSVVSDGLSISGISVIRNSNPKMTSPLINFRLEE